MNNFYVIEFGNVNNFYGAIFLEKKISPAFVFKRQTQLLSSVYRRTRLTETSLMTNILIIHRVPNS
jgi:hypothetical protein